MNWVITAHAPFLVTDLWPNRMIGDQKLPKGQPIT
jgi:hypothetical protein